jgi:hypothetical protein
MPGGKGEGVDTAKLAIRPALDEFFDRAHRFRLCRLSQSIEQRVGFAAKIHGTIGLITVRVTLWLEKRKASTRCVKHSDWLCHCYASARFCDITEDAINRSVFGEVILQTLSVSALGRHCLIDQTMALHRVWFLFW